MSNSTKITSDFLTKSYTYFNRELFDNKLDDCLITLQRKRGTYGYFASKRFASANDESAEKIVDEIALNPSHFSRGTKDVLSTLVHEMVHKWQFQKGKPSYNGYHNKEWAKKMEDLGLIPSSTGFIGGKRTGRKMSHYIQENGLFEKVCERLLAQGLTVPYVDLWENSDKITSEKKNASKTKYTCPNCGLNAWAKPNSNLYCGNCMVQM
jgi:predicted SprT family Zn-dependent metalloprotease